MSDYAIGIFDNLPSRKSVKNAIKEGLVFINDQPGNTGDWVTEGMRIVLYEQEDNKPIYHQTIEVVFEDDYLAIVNKPAGLVTSGNRFRTLENALPDNLKPSNESDAYKKPKPVHRLDRATSGLVIVAKTKSVRVELGNMLEKRAVKKTYAAVVNGIPPESGRIELPIDKKASISHYKRIKQQSNPEISLVELIPDSGRTHQLRIHCQHAGFPIVGDRTYGAGWNPRKGMFLCAVGLEFQHPVTNELISVRVDLPKKFDQLL